MKAKPSRAPTVGAKQKPRSQTESQRLNRYIAQAGVCARRKADELIKQGHIRINRQIIRTPGTQVQNQDNVYYKGRLLRAQALVYILLNKPRNCLCTCQDTHHRPTVFSLLPAHIDKRLFPVGRLDRNSTGLLLLTNDGAWAQQIAHPSFGLAKRYKITLYEPITQAALKQLTQGIPLHEGTVKMQHLTPHDPHTLSLSLHIGYNRVLRRVFDALDYQIKRLDRTHIAFLDKKHLAQGQWRYLRANEIQKFGNPKPIPK